MKRSFRKIPITFLTGPTASGKSTLAKLLAWYLASPPFTDDSPHLLLKDTSECIEHGKNKLRLSDPTAAKKLHELQQQGIILDGKIVARFCMEDISASGMIETINCVNPGSPRSIEEIREYDEHRWPFRIVFIECDGDDVDKHVQENIALRQKIEGVRYDESADAVRNKIAEYNAKVLPMIEDVERWDGDCVIRIKRNAPIIDRLRSVVEHMFIPQNVRGRWLDRLDNPNHLIHTGIETVESGVKLEPPHKMLGVREFYPQHGAQPAMACA